MRRLLIFMSLTILLIISCSKEKDNNTLTNENKLKVGQDYQGGKIAYILQIGDTGYISGQTHGLIIAKEDQSTGLGSIEWGTNGIGINATSISFGTGLQNTLTIINADNYSGFAASICYNLISNEYSDWYLPSKDEMYKIYLNKNSLNLGISYYWTSSEFDADHAWATCIMDGEETHEFTKNCYGCVRAVRSF